MAAGSWAEQQAPHRVATGPTARNQLIPCLKSARRRLEAGAGRASACSLPCPDPGYTPGVVSPTQPCPLCLRFAQPDLLTETELAVAFLDSFPVRPPATRSSSCGAMSTGSSTSLPRNRRLQDGMLSEVKERLDPRRTSADAY